MERKNKVNLLKSTLVAGALISVSSLGAAPASSNLFNYNALGSGSQVRTGIINSHSPFNAMNTFEAKCGEKSKTSEAKCGEGKCGEGKCGEGAKASADSAKTKSAEAKATEAKCGEGKCGEGKCGEGEKKAAKKNDKKKK